MELGADVNAETMVCNMWCMKYWCIHDKAV